MLTEGQAFFTAAEAAALTQLTLKAVNNAIDKKPSPPALCRKVA